jgi:hypothetical protein
LFTKYDVTEVPLGWEGNDNLRAVAKYRKNTHQKTLFGIPFKA